MERCNDESWALIGACPFGCVARELREGQLQPVMNCWSSWRADFTASSGAPDLSLPSVAFASFQLCLLLQRHIHRSLPLRIELQFHWIYPALSSSMLQSHGHNWCYSRSICTCWALMFPLLLFAFASCSSFGGRLSFPCFFGQVLLHPDTFDSWPKPLIQRFGGLKDKPQANRWKHKRAKAECQC